MRLSWLLLALFGCYETALDPTGAPSETTPSSEVTPSNKVCVYSQIGTSAVTDFGVLALYDYQFQNVPLGPQSPYHEFHPADWGTLVLKSHDFQTWLGIYGPGDREQIVEGQRDENGAWYATVQLSADPHIIIATSAANAVSCNAPSTTGVYTISLERE